MEPTLAELAGRAAALRGGSGRAILGITGPPGAGKSTLATVLVDQLRADGVDACLVPMDGFHLSQAELVRRGLRDVMGRIDTFDAAGYLALLRRLREPADRTLRAPAFDRTVEEPVPDAIDVGPEVQIVVTEGNYLLDDEPPWPEVRSTLAEVWFTDVDEMTRRRRLQARHVRFGKTLDETRAWMTRVDGPNARRISRTRGRADLTVSVQ